MIERQHGEQTLLCDECDDDLGQSFNIDEFRAMIEYAKVQCWKIKPDGEGGWNHFCPSCAEDHLSRLERARKTLGL